MSSGQYAAECTTHFARSLKKKQKKKKKEMEATAVTPGEILQDVVFFLFFLLNLLHCRRWIHLSSADYKLQAPRSKHLLLSFYLSLSLCLPKWELLSLRELQDARCCISI